ncbi:hypothetical protein ACFVTE_23750 [Arthrobacter sp. NPDC058097]|uniref:hypothetical protein n=1 Tax=Arthrobacter sp. NPDC058097 TaxID=3346340 RepID=UPI0036D77DB8
MAGEHLKVEARVVITDLDANGKSTIVSDGNSRVRTAQPGFTVNELWQIDNVPGHILAPNTLGAEPVIDPPASGLTVRIAAFPPDSEFDAEGYKASLDAFHGADTHGGDGADDSAGVWHETDTVDVVTIISGEVYTVTETGETLLKPGDTVINRGVKHIWSNRSDQPVVVVATMVAANR